MSTQHEVQLIPHVPISETTVERPDANKSNVSYVSTQIEREFRQSLHALDLSPEQYASIQLKKTPAAKQKSSDGSNIAGDFGFPCFAFAKEMRRDPKSIAQEFAEKLNNSLISEGMILRYEAVGGYVNLHLDYQKYGTKVITQAVEMAGLYGSENIGKGMKIVFDSSSPNVAKRMSIGHLRSTIIGHSLARIFKYSGYEVIRDNHIGDWGTGFGHILYAIEKWGNLEEIAKNPIPTLQSLYVQVTATIKEEKETIKKESEARGEKGKSETYSYTELAGAAYFQRLEAGDPEVRAMWKQIVDWSLVEFQQVYDLLGIEFDMTMGESEYENQLDATVSLMNHLGVTQKHEGALVVDLKKADPQDLVTEKADETSSKVIIQKSDGTSLYITRDLATALDRFERLKAERIVYVVGDEQRPYFEELFAILELLGYPATEKMKHVYFGLMRLPEGKMSTRRGRVVLLEELINEAFARTARILEEKKQFENDSQRQAMSQEETDALHKQVAVGGLLWTGLAQDRKTSIVFDVDENNKIKLDKAISLEGNSAAYVQYTYARTQSLLAKVDTGEIDASRGIHPAHPSEKELVNLIAEFPMAVQKARTDYDPSAITDAVFAVAQAYNTMYMNKELPILKAETIEERTTRVGLTESVAHVIKNGLYLLGIEAPTRM